MMKKNNNFSLSLSAAITWLRFPLIFFIILLHCYSVVRINGTGSSYFHTVYPFALWLGETGVPGFFFISGYLFFLSKKSYGQKLKTRVHTLLIPYLLWNGALLALYLIAYAAGYPQDINHKNIAEYGIIDYIRLFWDRGDFSDGNFVPLLCPFWYIRNLLIMSILSPLLCYIIRYTREVFLLIVAAWWLTTYHNAFIPQTILFFSLGAYFSILEINPLEIAAKKYKWVIVLTVLTAIADIGSHSAFSTPISLQLHRMALIMNIPALLLLADWCMQRGFHHQLFPNAAFIVFAVHYPIVVVLRKLCAAKFTSASDVTHVFLYFACIIIATALSLFFYALLEKCFPKLKNILSGNR
jgi:peptidoglycan/LPS O-acetylase OafA/YrhL